MGRSTVGGVEVLSRSGTTVPDYPPSLPRPHLPPSTPYTPTPKSLSRFGGGRARTPNIGGVAPGAGFGPGTSNPYQGSSAWATEAARRARFESSFTQPPNPIPRTSPTLPLDPRSAPKYKVNWGPRPTITPRPASSPLATPKPTVVTPKPSLGLGQAIAIEVGLTAAAPIGEALGDWYFNDNAQALNPLNPASPIGVDAFVENLKERQAQRDQPYDPFGLEEILAENPTFGELLEDLFDPLAPEWEAPPDPANPETPSDSPLEPDSPTDPTPPAPTTPAPPPPIQTPPWREPNAPGGTLNIPPIQPGESGTVRIWYLQITYPIIYGNEIWGRPEIRRNGFAELIKSAGEVFAPETRTVPTVDERYPGWFLLPQTDPIYAEAVDWLFYRRAFPGEDDYPEYWWKLRVQSPALGDFDSIPWIRIITDLQWIPDPEPEPEPEPEQEEIPWPDLWPEIGIELETELEPVLVPVEGPHFSPDPPVLFPELEPLFLVPDPPILFPADPPIPEIEIEVPSQRGPQEPVNDPVLDPPIPEAPPPPSQVCRYQEPWARFDQVDSGVAKNFAEFGIAATQRKSILDRLGDQLTDGGIANYLKKVQEFQEKAWRFSRADKIINALTLAAALHNAAQISKNLGLTLGEVASQVLTVFGVKDESGNPIDVNEVLGGLIEGSLKALLGEPVYNGLSSSWNRASRILSSASQVVWTVRSMADATQELLEWTAENTGRIGNALRRWGVVGERAYPWMAERATAQARWRQRFQRFTDGTEALDDAASSFSQVTGNVLEIQEELQEFQENKASFATEIATALPKEAIENAPIAADQSDQVAASTVTDSIRENLLAKEVVDNG